MERSFLQGNPPKITDIPTEKIINDHWDIKLEDFKENELETFFKNIKALNEMPP